MQIPDKPAMMNYKKHVLVCCGNKCTQNNEGLDLYIELKEKLKAAGLDKGNSRIIRSKTTCLGICQAGPIVCVHPDGIWYSNINSKKLDRIINEHLIDEKPVSDFVFHSQK